MKREIQRDIEREVNVICDCLAEEEGLSINPSQISKSISPQSSLAPTSVSEEKLAAQDWMEEPFPPLNVSAKASKLRVELDRGSFYRPVRYLAAGLSPNCKSAFFLSEDFVVIYSLNEMSTAPIGKKNIMLRVKVDKNFKYEGAALSDNFLAVITRADLTVYKCGKYLTHEPKIGMQSFELESTDYRWDPTCLAIYEAGNRAWISVGGRTNEEGQFRGSIKVFQIDIDHHRFSLARHNVSFNRPSPDPLKRDFLKMIGFSSDGQRLVCTTNNNRVLIWFLSNNARPRHAPFEISKRYIKVGYPHRTSFS